MHRKYLVALGACTTFLSCGTFATPSCYQAQKFDQIESCINLDGLISHLKAFQIIADENAELPGSRFTNTEGFETSKNYIVNKLREAGYKVKLQNVPISVSYVTTPSTFELNYPEKRTFERNVDYTPAAGSGSIDLTTSVQMPLNADGCDKANFVDFKKGNLALVSYGNCSTIQFINNAVAAGASGVIVQNQTPNIMLMGFETSVTKNLPIVLITSTVGESMKNEIESGILPKVHLQLHAIKKEMNSQNIIAESKDGDDNHIIMAGAHFDSLTENSGMNDNASSSGALLETALVMQNLHPKNKLRFAWWTGEELGLIGSNYYVQHLTDIEKKKIAVYLNAEILGAPNGGRLIMDTKDGVTSPGSEEVVKVYAEYFKSHNLKYYAFDPELGHAVERSDMYAFIQSGIPTGYLVSGANIPWNPLLTMIFTDLPDRKNGVLTHPCYHNICDKLTLDEKNLTDPNFDFNLYLQMSRAQAYAIYTYAMSTR